ncbi:MAG: hypothetical protein ACFWUJ_20925 [Pseudomonas fragi]
MQVKIAGAGLPAIQSTRFVCHTPPTPSRASPLPQGSSQRLEYLVDRLEHLGLAPLAPDQHDHLFIRLNLVDIGRQLAKLRQQALVLAFFLPAIEPFPRCRLPIAPNIRLSTAARAVVLRAGTGGGCGSSQCGHSWGASCMDKPMRRASMRRSMRPLCPRDGRNHARGLRTSARIDTTIHTVISVLSLLDKRVTQT